MVCLWVFPFKYILLFLIAGGVRSKNRIASGISSSTPRRACTIQCVSRISRGFSELIAGAGMNGPSPNDGPGRLHEEFRSGHTNTNNSGNPLWSLYEQEIKGYDKARIQDLKDDMKGVLIFVRVYRLSMINCD